MKYILGVLVVIVTLVILTCLGQYLWNWLIVDIFELKELTFKEMFGLILLCRLLFAGT